MADFQLSFDELHRTLLYADTQGDVRFQVRTPQQIKNTPPTERVWRPEWKSDADKVREAARPRTLAEIHKEHSTAWVMNQTEDKLPGAKLSWAYHGFEFVGGELWPTILYRQWDGQKFTPSATSWELKRSVLSLPLVHVGNERLPVGTGRDWFSPVVVPGKFAGQAQVIGHLGVVGGGDLIAPQGTGGTPGDVVQRGGLLFVTEQPRQPRAPDGWATVGFTSHTYQVYTTPDGQVLRVKVAKDGDALKDANWVLDIVASAVAPVAVRLATRGVQTVRSLVGRLSGGGAARTVLAGATKELAESAAAAAAGGTVREVGLEAAMAARGLKIGGWERRMGVPQKHFQKMVEAARETRTVAVFRANKEVAVDLIEKGAVGKPKALSIPKFKSSDRTGVLTAVTPQQVELVQKNGYYLLEVGPGKPPMMRLGNELKPLPRQPYWQTESGQVIEASGHPVVGDYDGLGALPLESPGRNLAPVPEVPTSLKSDWLGPDWKRYMDAVNPKLDKYRVLHGAQDQLPLAGGGLDDGLAYAVFPDGRAVILNGRAEQAAFYQAFERQTMQGAYPRPSPGTPVVDELASRRTPKPTGWR